MFLLNSQFRRKIGGDCLEHHADQVHFADDQYLLLFVRLFTGESHSSKNDHLSISPNSDVLGMVPHRPLDHQHRDQSICRFRLFILGHLSDGSVWANRPLGLSTALEWKSFAESTGHRFHHSLFAGRQKHYKWEVQSSFTGKLLRHFWTLRSLISHCCSRFFNKENFY